MAELTHMDEKLAEVLGLARAAQDATRTVRGLLDDDALKSTLEEMGAEARETAERCESVASTRNGKKTAIIEKARETKREAADMMSTYLGADADGLDGFEFLTMAEAGEVGHWEVLGAMARSAGNAQVGELVSWALPIQERHLATVRECSVSLARAKDPEETA
jgi:hypothetical protein